MPIVLGTTSSRSRPAFRTIIRLASFERSSKGMLSEREQARLDYALACRPDAGVIMSGTGGLRKLRVAVAGRGKRGSVRVIYYYHVARERVYLILTYAKNVKQSVSGQEKERLRMLTAALEAEP